MSRVSLKLACPNRRATSMQLYPRHRQVNWRRNFVSVNQVFACCLHLTNSPQNGEQDAWPIRDILLWVTTMVGRSVQMSLSSAMTFSTTRFSNKWLKEFSVCAIRLRDFAPSNMTSLVVICMQVSTLESFRVDSCWWTGSRFDGNTWRSSFCPSATVIL